MVNIHRGEIEAVIDGRPMTLCLTLGALAELEARLGAGDLVDLGEKFSKGQVSARHLIAILGAGLRGGGASISDEELAALPMQGGLKGAAEIAAHLLRATFGAPQS
jgi:Phage tail tube protein, GTA-gp10